MRKDQIPEFVEAVLDTGCPMCAIGHELYVIAQCDVPDSDFDRVCRLVEDVCDAFGDRDHLRLEIAAHLRSIGRYIEIEAAADH